MGARPACPKCGCQEIAITTTEEGTRGRCSNCGAILRIRRAGAPVAASGKKSRSAPVKKSPTLGPVKFHEPRNPAKSVYSGPEVDQKTLLDIEAGVPLEWKPGDVILDIYEVTKVHSRGGMGYVYKVWHRVWNVDLAVKSPRPEVVAKAGGPELFKREAETWASLGLHPHIVSCYYVRNLGGIPRVFAEYVPGGSLHDWIRVKRLYAGESGQALKGMLDVCIQFAWGLAYAHRQGLINQDVKPGNVMMTPDGVAKVTDFGLAGAKPQTGTPAYCSPEQDAGAAKRRAGIPSHEVPPMTPATDIWSWAVSVLEMFLGEMTWASGLLAPAVLQAYLDDGPVYPEIPPMPAQVADLLRGCLKEDPSERPDSMQEIADRLAEIYLEVTGGPYTRYMPSAVKDTADSLNNRAVSMLDLGNRREAERLWKAALHAEPHHPQTAYNRGLFLWRSARITDVALIEMLEKMRLAQGENWIGPYLLALVQMERADFESAVHTLKRITWEAVTDEVRSAYRLAKKQLPQSSKLLRTFERHEDAVTSVCLSHDRRHALSGGRDRKIKLWEVDTGRCEKTFVFQKHPIESLAMTGDGRFALSAGGLNLQLWELSTGRCVQEYYGHQEKVYSVSMSADGRFALSRSYYELKTWDVLSARCIKTLEADYENPLLLGPAAISGDGRFALSSRGSRLRLWDVRTGQCLANLENGAGKVESVAMSFDGRYAVVGSGNETMSFWDLSESALKGTCRGSGGKVESVGITHDGRYALATTEGLVVRLWELTTGRCLRTFEGHTGQVRSVYLSPDGRYAVSGGADGTVKLWNINPEASVPGPVVLSRVMSSERAVTTQALHEMALAEAASCMGRGDLTAGLRNAREARSLPGYERNRAALTLWNMLHHKLPRTEIRGAWEDVAIRTGKRLGTLCISRDARHVLAAGGNALSLIELSSGRTVIELRGHEDEVLSVSLSPDGRYALSGARDRTMRLWDMARGNCLRIFQEGSDVRCVALTHDSMYSVSAAGRSLRLWEISTGRCLRRFEDHRSNVSSFSLGADGRYVLSASDDTTLKLWVLATGECKRTLTGHFEEVSAVRFLPGERQALSGSASVLSGEIKLWNVETGDCLQTFRGHNAPVSSISTSLDGRHALVAGSTDSVMKLWDIAAGQAVHSFTGRPATAAGLSHDAHLAVSCDAEGDMRRWTLDWELAERTQAEWDDGALPYLEIFLSLHTPYNADLPPRGVPSHAEIWKALARRGKPSWSEQDFTELMEILGCTGYGWLTSQGVRKKLEEIASKWMNARPLL